MTKVIPTRETGVIRVIGKERALKSGPRIKLLSAIDEVASALGRAHASSSDARLRELLLCVQCDLSLLMAEVAMPPHRGETVGMTITPAMVQWLEAMTAALRQESDLPNASLRAMAWKVQLWLWHARSFARQNAWRGGWGSSTWRSILTSSAT